MTRLKSVWINWPLYYLMLKPVNVSAPPLADITYILIKVVLLTLKIKNLPSQSAGEICTTGL